LHLAAAQEIENLAPPEPGLCSHYLSQLVRLRRLSLIEVETEPEEHRWDIVNYLPNTLEKLQITMVSPVQVPLRDTSQPHAELTRLQAPE
jgi:hypothetical protein